MSVSRRLREATRDAHAQLDKVPFLDALSRGETDPRHYLGYLHALSIVHGVLETLASRSTHPAVAAIWRESMRKLPLLESDIASVMSGDPACASAPVGKALKFAQEMRTWSLTEPPRLLGALYVLEGSTNGGMAMAGGVEAALGLGAGEGVQYLGAYGDDQPEEWRAFKTRLDQAAGVAETYEPVLEGALRTFEAIASIADSISEGPLRVHATALNPEAGSHQVPQEPEVLEAVRQAAAVCLEEVPYVLERYGERGRRFTLSDGAWQATLPEFPEPVVFRQVDWLGRFLSGLGLPRSILERHLGETSKALSKAFPERASEFDVLDVAAARMATAALEVMPEEHRGRVRDVLRSGGGIPGHFEEIWLSAMADEIAFAHGALDETLSWLDTEAPWGRGVAELCRHSLEAIGARVDS